MTSIAVLECVEQGRVELDEDATTIVHELREFEVLTGFDGDKALLEKRITAPSVRYVFTHISHSVRHAYLHGRLVT